jgi:hypothetical protein
MEVAGACFRHGFPHEPERHTEAAYATVVPPRSQERPWPGLVAGALPGQDHPYNNHEDTDSSADSQSWFELFEEINDVLDGTCPNCMEVMQHFWERDTDGQLFQVYVCSTCSPHVRSD